MKTTVKNNYYSLFFSSSSIYVQPNSIRAVTELWTRGGNKNDHVWIESEQKSRSSEYTRHCRVCLCCGTKHCVMYTTRFVPLTTARSKCVTSQSVMQIHTCIGIGFVVLDSCAETLKMIVKSFVAKKIINEHKSYPTHANLFGFDVWTFSKRHLKHFTYITRPKYAMWPVVGYAAWPFRNQ